MNEFESSLSCIVYRREKTTMATKSSGSSSFPHALVVPGGGQGHVVGAMLLSQSLAALGFKVSFIYFSSSYARLKEWNRFLLPSPEFRGDVISTIDGDDSHVGYGGRGKIDLRVLQDDFAPGDLDKHFYVSPAMKENLYCFMVKLQEQGDPPTCLISDSFVPWTLEASQRAGIPRVELWTSNATTHLLITNFAVLYSEGIFPEKGSQSQWKRETPLMLSHIPGLPPLSSELAPNELRFAESSSPLVQSLMQVASCVKSGERLLINSVLELEPDAFKAYEVQGTPAYAIGPLPTQMQGQDNAHQTEGLTWLDLRAESSVTYVAFGSYAKLPIEDMQELAFGLEASGSPFLWVIREDMVPVEELAQVLPDGFLERMSASGKGMIISWAPQVEVLAHKAIGGFLSHCGWNSTVESLWAGVPMLCCPRFAEQRLNSHYLCNMWGAGLELGRTDTGGLERSFVEDGVKALLHSEEGVKARRKVQEIKHLIEKTSQKGGQSFTNLQKFYDDMRALC